MSPIERAFCCSPAWRAFTRSVVLPWALQGVQLSGDVLEIGGGSGAMAEAIAGRFPAVRLTVTDYDQAMVEAARRRLAPLARQVQVRQADAAALPFGDGSFDAAVSFIMLHHVVAWEKALAELMRVLRPGGRLVGYDLLATKAMRLLHQAEGSRHRMMTAPELRATLGSLPVAKAHIAPGFGGFVTRFCVTRATDHHRA